MSLGDAAWTGTEMVVVGSELDNRNVATTKTAVAPAYDPQADSWRRLPDPPVSSQTSAVAFVDDRLIAWEAYVPGAAELLPGEDRWRSLETGDLGGGECYAEGVTSGDALFTWNCGTPEAWFAADSSWSGCRPCLSR